MCLNLFRIKYNVNIGIYPSPLYKQNTTQRHFKRISQSMGYDIKQSDCDTPVIHLKESHLWVKFKLK